MYLLGSMTSNGLGEDSLVRVSIGLLPLSKIS